MRRIRSRLTFANAMSIVAVFIALGGAAYAANTVRSTDIVNDEVYSADVRNDTLTGGGLTAVDLRNGSVGNTEIADGGVRSSDVQNESLSGLDVQDNSLGGADIDEATLTGDTRLLVFQAPATDVETNPPKTTMGTVAGYSIKGQCVAAPFFGGIEVLARLYVNGPAGTANTFWSETENDADDLGNHSTGLQIPANLDLEIAVIDERSPTTNAQYQRSAGTAMLRSGSTFVQVDFHAVADARGGGSCFIYATATKAT